LTQDWANRSKKGGGTLWEITRAAGAIGTPAVVLNSVMGLRSDPVTDLRRQFR
jgi:hypothetical protein